MSYGFYHGGDPRRFHPDCQSCSEVEITAHKHACALWDQAESRGDAPPDAECESGWIYDKDGKPVMHVLKSSFGIGGCDDEPRIFVDSLRACRMSGKWKWPVACHMYVMPDDDLEELHAFADGIGLRRAWFQNDDRLPHYDLNASRRRLVVAAGAVEVNIYHTASAMKRWKKTILNEKTA